MNYREARKIARTADCRLNLPSEVTLDSIRKAIESSRCQPITIVELPRLTGADVCALWLVLDDQDLIIHAPTRSPWHRQHLILHEFSHMILHHDIHATSPCPPVQLPGLDISRIRSTLNRSSYRDDDELTAEALADRLATRLIHSTTSRSQEPLSFNEVFG